MKAFRRTLLSVLPLAASLPCGADMIPFERYIQLKNGMTEAEILYRAGPPDYESVATDRYDSVLRRVWFYMPPQPSGDAWISEIEFDRGGIVQQLRRYRARR